MTPAPLTITADDRSKAYGTPLFMGTTGFTATGLVLTDRVDQVTLTSLGADAAATVTGGPYAIDAANALGQGLGNYAIAYLPGELTVTPAPLTITADDRGKTYGTVLSLGTSAVSTRGLLLNDSVDSVALASAGAAAPATVSGGPYAITPSGAQGQGLDNYAIAYVPGTLTVAPAPLTITADDRIKTYGTALALGTTDFTASGLVLGDTVSSVTLTSAGASAQAGVSSGPYAIDVSSALGSGLDNYTIAYLPGALSVAPAPLTITATDQSKTYGAALDLGTSAFLVQGLRLSDRVDGVQLDSAGAAAPATVAGGPYAITPSGVLGQGLGNYVIAYLPGTLSVNPAPLTVAARSLTKPKGTTLNFAGTEFEVRGLVQLGDGIIQVNLQSPGADLAARDGTYAIQPGSAQGFGLSNYVISYAAGELVVSSGFFTPPLNKFEAPPNPRDRIGGGGSVNWRDGGEGSNRSRSTRETLGLFRRFNTLLDARIKNCSALADSDINAYLSCLSEALAQFAASLDEIATELPPGLENVARIIDTARAQVDQARSRAETRLQSATSDGERAAIRLDAIAEARGAVQTAAVEIRKAIALVRVEDPELADLQRTQILNTATALEAADIELSRVVGL